MNHLPIYPKAFIAAAKLNREKNRVFVAMPFRATHSTTLWRLIQQTCKLHHATPRRGDSPVHSVPIVADILDEMERAEIIIADLTGLNANVFYELGIAHVRCDKVILLCERGQIPPFDLAAYRCLYFDLYTAPGRAAFRKELGQRLDEMLQPSGTPTFIEGLIERTHSVIADLELLTVLPDEDLARETVWFNGFLSTLAVSEEEVFPPDQEKYRAALFQEKDKLLELARRGCTLRCIISPPGKDESAVDRFPHAIPRLRTLISFLKSADPALKNIDWVISPFRQQNSYIIGSISFSEGFKSDVERGYSLTLRQTGTESIRSAVELQRVLFDRLRSYTLTAFPNQKPQKDGRAALRLATLRCLEESLEYCVKFKRARDVTALSRKKGRF